MSLDNLNASGRDGRPARHNIPVRSRCSQPAGATLLRIHLSRSSCRRDCNCRWALNSSMRPCHNRDRVHSECCHAADADVLCIAIGTYIVIFGWIAAIEQSVVLKSAAGQPGADHIASSVAVVAGYSAAGARMIPALADANTAHIAAAGRVVACYSHPVAAATRAAGSGSALAVASAFAPAAWPAPLVAVCSVPAVAAARAPVAVLALVVACSVPVAV